MENISEQVQVPKWPAKFQKGEMFSAIMIASRNSGKSHLSRYLLKYQLRDKFDMFVIFCQSTKEMADYQRVFPTDLAFSDFNPAIVEDLITANKKRQKEEKTEFKILVLVDDNIVATKNDQTLLKLYCTGRHNGVSVIFLAQSTVLTSTTWRQNSDLIFLLRQISPKHRDQIKENFLMDSINLPDEASRKDENVVYTKIMKYFLAKTGDALVLDVRHSNKTGDRLFYFRAPKNI